MNLDFNQLPNMTSKEKQVLEESLVYLLNGDLENAPFEEGLRNVVAILLEKDEATFTREKLFNWYNKLEDNG